MLYIGASGFSYQDWVGPFYPAGLPKNQWLTYYAREFRAVEVNATYYAVPAPRTLEQMAAKTPAAFLFTVKAHQDMTHKRHDNEAVFAAFVRALQPLVDQGRLGCVLAQFPFSFHATELNRQYLSVLRERLPGLPVVAEFRNRQWITPDTFALLRRLDLGFCCVDEPDLPGLIPPAAEATSDIAYVRFHGRNAAKWFNHKEAYERYDYTYRRDELAEWVPRIRDLDAHARLTFLFANNHWMGQAVDTARLLKDLLGAE